MSAPSVSSGQLLGHYRIIEQIGAGGMGIVFLAHDEQLDRDVALKILPSLVLTTEPARRQFRREAQSIARISHPNVATAFDFGHQDGMEFLVTEYVPGLSLDVKLASGVLAESEILHLGTQLASGLEAAHREGVIHRDLKPSNLKVSPTGQLKILDFGLAMLLDRAGEADAASTVTHSFRHAGTPAYMAPEQVTGAAVDRRTDIWAAGAVLYEMSTGRRPFHELSGAELQSAILHQKLTSPRSLNPNIGKGLDSVISKALEKNRASRYQTAQGMLEDLSAVSGGSGTLPRKVGSSFRSARAGIWLAVLLLLLIGSAFLFQSIRSRRSTIHNKVVAVLPFDSIGNDSSTNALGLGLTETVTAKLVQASSIGDVQLVSAREVIAQGVRDAEHARREFGTDLVLEGSLQQSGSQIRITCSVVDSKTHRQVAARTLTGTSDDIFALQDRFANELLEMLAVVVQPERRYLLGAAQNTQATAYDFYLRGRGYLQEYEKPENLDSAIAQFQRALQIDSKYAPAYAGVGTAYVTGFQQGGRPKDWLDQANENCQHALTLAEDLTDAHTCLGNVHLETGRYENAVKDFQRSLDLKRNNDEALGGLADAYQKLGNASGAEEAYRSAISLRPGYWGGYSGLGAFFYTQARYAEAAEMFRRVTELAPENYRGFSNLGGVELFLGRYPEAIAALKTSIALRPDFESYGNLGNAYFLMHDFESAATSFENALKLNDKDWGNWGSLGDALMLVPSRKAEAAPAYKKAIELAAAQVEVNPRDATALSCAADYKAILGNRKGAVADLKRALDVAPKDPDVSFRGAILYNLIGDADSTIKFLQQAVDLGFSRNVIRDTPDFDHLKNDARVRAMLSLN